MPTSTGTLKIYMTSHGAMRKDLQPMLEVITKDQVPKFGKTV